MLAGFYKHFALAERTYPRVAIRFVGDAEPHRFSLPMRCRTTGGFAHTGSQSHDRVDGLRLLFSIAQTLIPDPSPSEKGERLCGLTNCTDQPGRIHARAARAGTPVRSRY